MGQYINPRVLGESDKKGIQQLRIWKRERGLSHQACRSGGCLPAVGINMPGGSDFAMCVAIHKHTTAALRKK
jgi:hypothetical protein